MVECRENEYRKHLLIECALAYAGLDDEQKQTLERLLKSERYREVNMVSLTWKEEGIEIGKEIGLRESLHLLVEHRFGPLTPSVRERLKRLPIERVRELLLEVLTAPSLQAMGLED